MAAKLQLVGQKKKRFPEPVPPLKKRIEPPPPPISEELKTQLMLLNVQEI
jgi:hypothetical protein